MLQLVVMKAVCGLNVTWASLQGLRKSLNFEIFIYLRHNLENKIVLVIFHPRKYIYEIIVYQFNVHSIQLFICLFVYLFILILCSSPYSRTIDPTPLSLSVWPEVRHLHLLQKSMALSSTPKRIFSMFLFNGISTAMSDSCRCLPPDRIWHKVNDPKGSFKWGFRGGHEPRLEPCWFVLLNDPLNAMWAWWA